MVGIGTVVLLVGLLVERGVLVPRSSPQRPTSLTQSWTYRAECENSGSVLESLDTVYSCIDNGAIIRPPPLIQPPDYSNNHDQSLYHYHTTSQTSPDLLQTGNADTQSTTDIFLGTRDVQDTTVP